MIQANELRIGNWVYYGQSIRPITAIHESPSRKCVGVDNMLTEFAVIQPIPLTPEILEKAGFTNDGDNYFSFEGYTIWFRPDEKECNYGWFLLSSDKTEAYSAAFDHVHQLQNLYFALTGEELKIEL